ncbi:hypothetical protein [Amycolatopsis thermoflava]|uniref:hypothetical protein n=1 Tax=Amycolatopsis thermoflava TaxID=84480 RepID=UPI003D74778F
MLATAAEVVARTGLTVGLDHLPFEGLIRQAGVARSAVYRKWPNKEAFLGDLLLELARGREAAGALARRILLARLDTLTTPDGRRAAAAELVRETALQDFRHLLGSPVWQTYPALTATAAGLPDGDLRDQVVTALAASERTFTARIARSHRGVADLLGLRPAGVSFETIAQPRQRAGAWPDHARPTATPELAEQRTAATIAGARARPGRDHADLPRTRPGHVDARRAGPAARTPGE